MASQPGLQEELLTGLLGLLNRHKESKFYNIRSGLGHLVVACSTMRKISGDGRVKKP